MPRSRSTPKAAGKNTKATLVRMDPALLERLDEHATATERSRAALIRLAVRRLLADFASGAI